MPMPLNGVRVLDLCTHTYGQFCSQILADFGAEVIKIEPPVETDYYAKKPHQINASSRNKKSFTLDPGKDEGKAVFNKLVEVSDVLITESSLFTELSSEIAYEEELKLINDKLVFCCLNEIGITDIEEDLSFSNFFRSIELNPHDLSVIFGVKIANAAGGILYPVIAILLALFNREKCGKGQVCDVDVADGTLNLLKYVLSDTIVPKCQLL